MNEPAYTFMCAILSSVCLLLFGYMLKTGDVSPMSVATVCAAVIVLISGFVIVCRHM